MRHSHTAGTVGDHPTWNHRAFTLVEVMVAILLVSVALVAVEASSAVLIRETSTARLESIAQRRAERERELAYGSRCESRSAADSTGGILVATTVTPGAGVLTGMATSLVLQRTSFRSGPVQRDEFYTSRGRCY